jgi:hypothetical protein
VRINVRASRCASAGWSSSLHPSGISVPTLLQHAPREPALLSWERFQVTMWSSLAPLLHCLHDTVLGDISSPCVSVLFLPILLELSYLSRPSRRSGREA